MARKSRFLLRMPGDTVAFNNANDLLQSLGVNYTRPSPHQLKIGPINYFPATGTIHVDGEPHARRERGKAALEALILGFRARFDRILEERAADAAARQRDEAAEQSAPTDDLLVEAAYPDGSGAGHARASKRAALIADALATIQQWGVAVRQVSPYQLKVAGDLSYYPITGKIVQDGVSTPRPQLGLEGLRRVIERRRARRAAIAQRSGPNAPGRSPAPPRGGRSD